MSLHASKGLEFDLVYMIGVEHGILPHDKAVKDRGERGLEEERRLCYVGFTRARKVLRVTWCGQMQDVYARDKAARYRPSLPSRFLVEAGLMGGEEYQRVVDEARVHVGGRTAGARAWEGGRREGAEGDAKKRRGRWLCLVCGARGVARADGVFGGVAGVLGLSRWL
jgi:hypothetical protein